MSKGGPLLMVSMPPERLLQVITHLKLGWGFLQLSHNRAIMGRNADANIGRVKVFEGKKVVDGGLNQAVAMMERQGKRKSSKVLDDVRVMIKVDEQAMGELQDKR